MSDNEEFVTYAEFNSVVTMLLLAVNRIYFTEKCLQETMLAQYQEMPPEMMATVGDAMAEWASAIEYTTSRLPKEDFEMMKKLVERTSLNLELIASPENKNS